MRRSTPLTWEQVRVGGLILAALTLLALGIFLVGEVGGVFGDRYRLVTVVPSAAGLPRGASVQLAGQNVGQVQEVRWIEPSRRPEGGEPVALLLAVNREVQPQIRADSRARLRTQGLLGDKVVDIEPGSAGARVLRDGDTLAAVPPLDYQQVLEQASGAVRDLGLLAGRLEELARRLLDGEGTLGRLVTDESLYRELASLSRSLSSTLRRAESGEGTLGRLLTDDALYRNLVSVTASLDTLTARVGSGEGTLGRMIASDSLYRELSGLAARSNRILGRLEEGRGTAGKVLTEDRLYEELLKTLVDLNAVLADLKEHPRRYIPPVRVF